MKITSCFSVSQWQHWVFHSPCLVMFLKWFLCFQWHGCFVFFRAQVSLTVGGWQGACACLHLPGARERPQELLLPLGCSVCSGPVRSAPDKVSTFERWSCFDLRLHFLRFLSLPHSEGDVVSLRLLQLAFSERKCLASGKILYEVCSERSRLQSRSRVTSQSSHNLTLLPVLHHAGSGVLWGAFQSGFIWLSSCSQDTDH